VNAEQREAADAWLENEVEDWWLAWLTENTEVVLSNCSVRGHEGFTDDLCEAVGGILAAYRADRGPKPILAAVGRLVDVLEPEARREMERYIREGWGD